MPEIVEVKKYLLNNKIINISILKGRYKKHKPFTGYNIIKKDLYIGFPHIKYNKFMYTYYNM